MSSGNYYVPDGSPRPITAVLAILMIFSGLALLINQVGGASILAIGGLLLLFYLFYAWFSDVIAEGAQGQFSEQVEHSFRQGMIWFIGSEVFFFAAFFGSLFYLRAIVGPWLGGEGYLGSTHILWDSFTNTWPLLETPDPSKYTQTKEAMGPWGIPAINTALLLSSGGTLTWAHWALKKGNRAQLNLGMIATIVLGLTFFGFQAYEYGHAYHELDLTLNSGVYGSTFYMLTGFHGFHVIVGTIMLCAILGRCLSGHFTADNHFAFEAVAWYWHFVDVVWLGLFIFVYWL